MKESNSKNQMQMYEPKKGDLVFAKITGYPWWPAIITETYNSNQQLYKVEFIADRTHAFLPLNKIISYVEGKEQSKNAKKVNRQLRQALAVAQQLYERIQIHKTEQGKLLRGYSQQLQVNKLIETEEQVKQLNFSLKIQLEKEPSITKSKPSYSEKKQKILQKQQFIQQILTKYNLLSIPTTNRYRIKNHRCHMIPKTKKIKHQSSQIQLIIKKIYTILKLKGVNKNIAQNIAISLGRLVSNQYQNKVSYTKNLFRWIKVSKVQVQISQNQIIEKYYDQWCEWYKNDHNREKPSDMTTYQ